MSLFVPLLEFNQARKKFERTYLRQTALTRYRLYNRLRELGEERERNHDLSREEVHQAYDRVCGRQLGSAVFISDLATELQIGVQKLHEWIKREVIKSGNGSLEDGHWPTPTEGQRAAAIEHVAT